MRPYTFVAASAALGIVFLSGAVDAQEAATAPSQAEVADQIVVLGKALADLRLRIELAENDVYARFNDINSNDLYDIHCYERPAAGTKVRERTCLSNAYRKFDVAYADATIRTLQGGASYAEGTPESQASVTHNYVPAQYRSNQLLTEKRVVDEMHELARTDPQLQAAMVRLGQAYQALEAVAGSRPQSTLYREVSGGGEGLPFEAERLFEVRMGAEPWSHPLRARTFTFTSMDGNVRNLRVECDERDARLEYADGMEWTIPESWGTCTLHVSAKRGTTFALYEFE